MKMRRQAGLLPYNALVLLVWMALLGAIHAASAQEPPDDSAAIRTLLRAQWDKPDVKLNIDLVIVDGDYALTGWTQAGRGGRALLRKSSGTWAVLLCSGDPLKHASALIEAGVPAEAAKRLARGLAAAESQLPTDEVALFSTFEGVMQVDAHRSRADHH